MDTDPWEENAFSVLQKAIKFKFFLEELRRTTINLSQDSKFKFKFKFNDKRKLKFPL
jgi:hypothetical protein